MNIEYDNLEDAIQDKKLLIQENIESIRTDVMVRYHHAFKHVPYQTPNRNLLEMCVFDSISNDFRYGVPTALNTNIKYINIHSLYIPDELINYTLSLLKQYDDVLLELI